MPKTSDTLKKFFLIGTIILFILAGLAGASFFLFGSNTYAWKSLETIGALIIYSIFGWLSARILDNKDFTKYLAIVELIFSTIALILILPIIWDFIDFSGDIGKVILSASVITFAIAHISIISGRMKNKWYKISYFTTIGFILTVSGLLIYGILNSFDTFGFYNNLLGFFAVLDVVGTIVTILLKRLK